MHTRQQEGERGKVRKERESEGDENREKQYAYASLRAARHTEATGTVKLTRMLLTVASCPLPSSLSHHLPRPLPNLFFSFSLSLFLARFRFSLSLVFPPSTLAFALLSYAFIAAAVYARYNCILGIKCSPSMHLFFHRGFNSSIRLKK